MESRSKTRASSVSWAKISRKTVFISSALFEIRLDSRSTSVVARSYFLSKMAYRKMPPFRTKWPAYGDAEIR